MTILFSGSISIPIGTKVSNSIGVSNALKKAGEALWVDISLDGDVFPVGTTLIGIEFSYDNGVSWRGASTECVMPRTWSKSQHVFGISYCYGSEDTPTHARYWTNAPSAFTCAVTVSAR